MHISRIEAPHKLYLFSLKSRKVFLLRGQSAGSVFYDFTDAFGNVNRKNLLYKIGKNFGISGKLFLHIQSFLTDRYARLKFGNTVEETGYFLTKVLQLVLHGDLCCLL